MISSVFTLGLFYVSRHILIYNCNDLCADILIALKTKVKLIIVSVPVLVPVQYNILVYFQFGILIFCSSFDDGKYYFKHLISVVYIMYIR